MEIDWDWLFKRLNTPYVPTPEWRAWIIRDARVIYINDRAAGCANHGMKPPEYGTIAWIPELADCPPMMIEAHSLGAERAFCDMVGIPPNLSLDSYRPWDIPWIDQLRMDIKNGWGVDCTLNVNVARIESRLERGVVIPELYTLVRGMVTKAYHYVGTMHRDDLLIPSRIVIPTDGNLPYYRATQRELWHLCTDKMPKQLELV